jgi:radical SAM protein with 4Fe4S-binding SPASM domain
LQPQFRLTAMDFALQNPRTTNGRPYRPLENTQKNPLFQDRMMKNTKCNKCSVQYYCKGGCPAKSYQENKDINFSDSSCTI